LAKKFNYGVFTLLDLQGAMTDLQGELTIDGKVEAPSKRRPDKRLDTLPSASVGSDVTIPNLLWRIFFWNNKKW